MRREYSIIESWREHWQSTVFAVYTEYINTWLLADNAPLHKLVLDFR